jgi:hypothetical protein
MATSKYSIIRHPQWTVRILVIVLLLAALVTTELCLYRRWYDRIRPDGAKVVDLNDRVTIVEAKRCIIGGREYYLLEARTAPSYFLPSGPPMYVYGLDGTLIEWVADVGESPEFRRRWMAEPTESVPVGEALREIQK